jgi:hypothetical protein
MNDLAASGEVVHFDGRFPEYREDVVAKVVSHLASQTGVPLEVYFEEEWSERTQRRQRAQIREYCGFQIFHAEDEPTFIAWLTTAELNTRLDAYLAIRQALGFRLQAEGQILRSFI